MRAAGVRTILSGILVLAWVGVWAEGPAFLTVEARSVHGHILVPLRAPFERLGATVNWDAESGIAKIALGGREVEVQLGYADALVTNQSRTDLVTWPVPPGRYGGRVFVPLRPICEALGVVTEYQSAGRVLLGGRLLLRLEPVITAQPAKPTGRRILTRLPSDLAEVLQRDKPIGQLAVSLDRLSTAEREYRARRAGAASAQLGPSSGTPTGAAQPAGPGPKWIQVVYPAPAIPTQTYSVLFLDPQVKLKGEPETEEAWQGALKSDGVSVASLGESVTVSYCAPLLDNSGKLIRPAQVVRSQRRAGDGWFSIDISPGIAAIKNTELGGLPVGPVLLRNPIWRWPCSLDGRPCAVHFVAKGTICFLGYVATFIPFSTDFEVVSNPDSPALGSRIEFDDGTQWPILGVAMTMGQTPDGKEAPVTGYIVVTKPTASTR